MQSAFYPQKVQEFGVPLDKRYMWTKSDWEMWAAACSENTTRKMFITKLAHWINKTSTGLALTDHYMTDGMGGYTE